MRRRRHPRKCHYPARSQTHPPCLRHAHNHPRAAIVDYGELPQPRNARWGGPLKKASYLKRQNKNTLSAPSSGPSTPSMRSGRSPLNPTSASTSTSPEARAELDALRIPLIHLLVLGPASEHSLASKTRAPEDLVLKVLHKVANKVNAGRHWALMDDVHRELDVWDFPYISPRDREKAIQNCSEAFDRLRLQRQAQEWRMLLSPEGRERADLNPEPEPVKPASVRLSSRPASESGRSPLPSSLESKKPAVKAATGRGAAKTTKPTKSDAISRIIGKGRKKAAAPAKPKGAVGRPPKNASAATGRATKPATQKQTSASTNPKIKSAETVDSDDDVDMEDVRVSTPKQQPVNKAVSPQSRPKAPVPKPPSRAASDIEGDGVYLNPNRKRTPAPSAAKSPAKRPRIAATSSASSSAALDPPVQSQPQSNGYPKAHSSATTVRSLASSRDALFQSSSSNSPPKPSPLGSSPPINASDADTGSTASSPFMLSNTGTSTASQSPLDSLSGRSQKPRYMPPAVSSLKRKAGSASQRDDSVRSGVKASSNGIAPNRRQLANPPDGQTMKLARKFKEDYSRYERLYREAQSVTDAARKRETIERVLALHRDLERLKSRISNLQMSH